MKAYDVMSTSSLNDNSRVRPVPIKLGATYGEVPV
jgi:hypothetical protein